MAGTITIVTGGSSGIGRAGAIGFAWNGESVPGADLKAEAAAAVVQDIRAGGVLFDSSAA
jgi:NAD(P)-dependent dehydrogenase (short-subunit alcohol dehydrogenase family)